MTELDPHEVARLLAERSGETMGKVALGEDVSHSDLYDAVAFSWISSRDTPEGAFSPDNHRIIELFITP